MKKQAPKAPPRRTAATRHGAAAFGAKYVRPGFAFTPARDLDFALGFPHYLELTDDDPADATPSSRSDFVAETGLTHLRPMPRGVALRMVRSFDTILNDALRLEAMGHPADELGEDEAAALVQQHFTGLQGAFLLYLVEALAGPDVVCKAALGQLAARGEAILGDDRAFIGRAIYDLGYLIRRLPEAAAAAAYAQLESLYQALTTKDVPPTERPSPVRFLDVVLHGAAGSARSGHRSREGVISYFFLGHVVDDPAYVARVVPAVLKPLADDEPDPRRAFLGGEVVLARELSAWKSYRSSGAQARMIERFGSIRSVQVLPMMLEMSATSRARREALAWFAEHRSFAIDFLAEAASGEGQPSIWAKDVLARIGAESG